MRFPFRTRGRGRRSPFLLAAAVLSWCLYTCAYPGSRRGSRAFVQGPPPPLPEDAVVARPTASAPPAVESSLPAQPTRSGQSATLALAATLIAGKAAGVLGGSASRTASATRRRFFGSGDSAAVATVGDETETANVATAFAAIGGWIGVMYAIQHSLISVPFLSPEQAEYFPIVATFVAGYAVIVFEEQLEINKAATALVLGVLMWVFVTTGLSLAPEVMDQDIKETLEGVSEVVFFLLGALTIVEIMDSYRGFDIITNAITATKKRDLLVIISVLTFVLSSVLNNLTVVIVMVSLLSKLVTDVEYRQRLGGIVVIASNAGGAWTPIGDITTTMLYIGGQVTTVPLLGNLFFPSVLCLIGALGYEYLQTDEGEVARPSAGGSEGEATPKGQTLVFWSGLLGMTSVPVFTALTACPAWCGMILVLGMMGVITSILYPSAPDRYSLKGATSRVEVPDALFFLGVLFGVGALERVGLLKEFAVQLGNLIPSSQIVAVLLGFASAVVDNVPLVAAAQGMYDVSTFPANDPLWNLITYCAGTGGSLLVIGSAAGIAFMGMEKGVSFGWYLKYCSVPALVGYLLGVAGIILQESLGLAIA